MEGRGVIVIKERKRKKKKEEEKEKKGWQDVSRFRLGIRRRIKGSWQRGVIRSYKCGWLIADSRFHGDALVKRAAER